MILLCAYGGLASLHVVPTDLRVLHGVYPLPTNSCAALLQIFPRAVSEDLRYHGIRLLQKTLQPGTVDIGTIVAMLCFWTQQQSGKIQWEEDELSEE